MSEVDLDAVGVGGAALASPGLEAAAGSRFLVTCPHHYRGIKVVTGGLRGGHDGS
ncbi:MAG: hypothetical protein JO309_16485 [Pseudonocardiales bacterium]|nr:hypothetical protein [Pseudonocardiales bacterium]